MPQVGPLHVRVRADEHYPDMEHEYSQIPSLTVTALDHYYESLPSLVNPSLTISSLVNPSLTTHIIRQNNATDAVNNAKENSLVSKRFHSLPVLDCIDYPGESEI